MHVAAVVEVLNDARSRGLGAETQILHELDEPALSIPDRRLRLLGQYLGLDHLDLFALAQGRKLLVHPAAVRVDAEPALLRHDSPADDQWLPAGLEAERGAQSSRRPREGGQEAPGDELVDLPLVLAQRLPGGVQIGRAHV